MTEFEQQMQRINNVVLRYLNRDDDAPAVETVMSVYEFIYAMRAVSAGRSGPDISASAFKSLARFLGGIGVNPFVTRCGGAFFQTVLLTLGGIVDGDRAAAAGYNAQAQGRTSEAERNMVRGLAGAQQLTNILLSAYVLWRLSPAGMLAISSQVREDMEAVL